MEGFDKHSSILKLKVVGCKGKHFLVIREMPSTDLIIDYSNKILNKEDALKYFSEKFLIEKFGEVKSDSKKSFEMMFTCLEYYGDVAKLIVFYVENDSILTTSTNIIYRVKLEDANAVLSIHINDGGNTIMFRTPDQRLYEHLFFYNNL